MITTLRVVARLASLVVLGILMAFLVGEGLGTPSSFEWIALMLFPMGVLVGFAISWWKETLGACVSLGSLLVFYGYMAMGTGHAPGGPYFFIFSSPAVLFLCAGLLRWDRRQSSLR